MDLHEMRSLVEACTYKPGWILRFNAGDRIPLYDGTWRYDRPYIQIEVTEESDASMESLDWKFERVEDVRRTPWKSGKKYLSEHMCRQEIVGAVFDAIKQAEMHEVHEWFRYNGASIYNPHLDPDALAVLAKRKHNFNVRENAMSMVET